MNDEWPDKIRQMIHEVAAGLTECVPWEQNIARYYDVLPLYGDIGGCLALRPDGEIVAIPDDPKQSMHIETDPLWRNMALYQGSKRYPQLQAMIPSRPLDAIDCIDCNGTGVHPITAQAEYTNMICKCGGLGWLPAQSHY